jgi:hypothetical protein
MFTARTAQEVMMKRLTGVPLNRGYLAVTSVMLGALLIGGGTGTAHAYTDSEAHYLFQLNELQVPGSDQTKLNLGNEVCAALRAGDRPRADIPVLQQRTGLSFYAATNVVMEATGWLCPDQNGKSDQDFWIGSPPGPNGGIVPEPPAPGPWTPSFPANPFPTR